MFFGLLTLFTALTIAGLAGYFSVIGLAALFAGAFWPVVFMAGSLEAGKLVLASWCWRNWRVAPLWMKIYFPLAIFVLMGVTSAGIYGYLAKSHLEFHRPAVSLEFDLKEIDAGFAEIDARQATLESEIAALNADKAEAKDFKAERRDALELRKASLNERIGRVNAKIERLQGDKQSFIDRIDAKEAAYAEQIANRFITKTEQQKEREKPEMDALRANVAAKDDEIAAAGRELDAIADDIDAVNNEIAALKADTAAPDARLKEIQAEIAGLPAERRELTLKRNDIEIKVASHKADIGPLIYVAKLVWPEDAEGNLDKAVIMLILILIFVFDPLAVALVIAGQQHISQALGTKSIPGNKGVTERVARAVVEEQAPPEPVVVEKEPETAPEPVVEVENPEPEPELKKKS